MTVRYFLACVLLTSSAISPGVMSAQARTITLEQALGEARQRSLELRAADVEIASAKADLSAARVSPYNPEVGFTIGPSRNSDTTITSYQVGVSQTLELGGKRGLRAQAARSRVQAAEARRDRARILVFASVRRVYGLAVVARQRLSASIEGDSVAQLLLDAANERLRLGAGTQLEVNVAAAAAAQSRRTRLTAEREQRTTLLELGSVIGLSPSESIEPADASVPPDSLPGSEEQLVTRALAARGDIQSAIAERRASESDLRLARRLAVPDPTLGVSAGKAEDFNVVEFGISLPLPLWNRGQGSRAQAGAALARADLVESAARRNAERDVRDAYRGLSTALEAERGFDRDVIGRLSENLRLAEESFRAGKIGLLVFNNIRRDLVEARLAYLDAVAEVVERSAALERASGGEHEIIK